MVAALLDRLGEAIRPHEVGVMLLVRVVGGSVHSEAMRLGSREPLLGREEAHPPPTMEGEQLLLLEAMRLMRLLIVAVESVSRSREVRRT